MASREKKRLRKVCLVTGTRAEYGLLKPVMDEILLSRSLELQVVVTGMHLLPEYGRTIDLIREDGIHVDAAVPLILGGDTKSSMAASIGVGVIQLTSVFDLLDPAIVVVLGDRYEALSAAIAASYTGRVLAHIGGGDNLRAGFDEYTRHAITKMAHLHFPSTSESANRIRKMGEKEVHAVGSTAIDAIQKLLPTFSGRESILRRYNFRRSEPLALLVYHPISTVEEQGIEGILTALLDSRCNVIAIYPNVDPGSRHVIDELRRVVSGAPSGTRITVVPSLPQPEYFDIMNSVDFMIGNSSSGIIETPYFRKPFIHVGERQTGRTAAGNVIYVGTGSDEIRRAIDRALHDRAFARRVRTCVNPYGSGGASRKIVSTLENLTIDDTLFKKTMPY
jgi:UDP-hydrolysing UDP-N-acetyl-D-glucosamine 2-epimerase